MKKEHKIIIAAAAFMSILSTESNAQYYVAAPVYAPTYYSSTYYYPTYVAPQVVVRPAARNSRGRVAQRTTGYYAAPTYYHYAPGSYYYPAYYYRVQ